jgi:FKBP-type peptidyl-prolyl cis-trans isomerase FkpA
MRQFKMREWIAVAVAVVGAAILFFGSNIWQFVTGGTMTINNQAAPINNNLSGTVTNPQSQQQMTNISTTPGLEIYDLKIGEGAEATAGKTIAAHYVGVLTDGTKFDSSLERGQPFEFDLGKGQVIKGWDMGIEGMKVGGIRRLVISPEFGYGNQAIGPIPAGSTLIFEVQLVGVKE